MKVNNKYLKISLISIFTLCIVIVGIKLSSVNYNHTIKPFEGNLTKSEFSLMNYAKSLPCERMKLDFNYKLYLDSGNWINIQSIYSDMRMLDTICGKSSMGGDIIYKSLTEELEKKLKPTLTSFNADTLIWLVQWAERFKYYAEVDQANASLFQPLNDHWMNFIANHLNNLYKNDESIKYDYKFRYLMSRCAENKYNIDIGNSKKEKFVYNIIDQQWSYILNRFIIGTSLLFKICIIIILSITLYGYFCIIKKILKK